MLLRVYLSIQLTKIHIYFVWTNRAYLVCNPEFRGTEYRSSFLAKRWKTLCPFMTNCVSHIYHVGRQVSPVSSHLLLLCCCCCCCIFIHNWALFSSHHLHFLHMDQTETSSSRPSIHTYVGRYVWTNSHLWTCEALLQVLVLVLILDFYLRRYDERSRDFQSCCKMTTTVSAYYMLNDKHIHHMVMFR